MKFHKVPNYHLHELELLEQVPYRVTEANDNADYHCAWVPCFREDTRTVRFTLLSLEDEQ